MRITPSSSQIANGGGLVVVNADGSVGLTPAGGTGVLIGVAPPATSHYALVQVGNGPVDGVTAGHYTGSAGGGGYGANFASGYTGDLLRLQIAGSETVAFMPGSYIFYRTDTHNPVLNISNSTIFSNVVHFMIGGIRNNSGPLSIGNTGDSGGTTVFNLLKLLAGGANLSSGSGAPTTPNGQNPTAGDYFFRTDTPSTANQRIYVCSVGGASPTWIGLV